MRFYFYRTITMRIGIHASFVVDRSRIKIPPLQIKASVMAIYLTVKAALVDLIKRIRTIGAVAVPLQQMRLKMSGDAPHRHKGKLFLKMTGEEVKLN